VQKLASRLLSHLGFNLGKNLHLVCFPTGTGGDRQGRCSGSPRRRDGGHNRCSSLRRRDGGRNGDGARSVRGRRLWRRRRPWILAGGGQGLGGGGAEAAADGDGGRGLWRRRCVDSGGAGGRGEEQ
jgi:hypothetical protein